MIKLYDTLGFQLNVDFEGVTTRSEAKKRAILFMYSHKIYEATLIFNNEKHLLKIEKCL